MELLYVWINQSENNVFKKQDFSFSEAYQFETVYDEDKDTMEIDIYKNSTYHNIFKNDVIINVTAIVGPNGSGKTNLLDYLLKTDIFPLLQHERLEYAPFNKEKNSAAKTIQIFRIEEEIEDIVLDQIVVYHNFGSKKIEVNIENRPIANENLIWMTNEKLGEFLKNPAQIGLLTKIYLSNSTYHSAFSRSENRGIIDKISLTPSTLRSLSNEFYRKFLTSLKYTRFYNTQDIALSTRNERTFQSICDLLYFYKLINYGKEKAFFGKIQNKLVLSCEDILKLIGDKRNDEDVRRNKKIQNDNKDIDAEIIRLEEKEKLWFECSRKWNLKNNVISRLKHNLVFELDFMYDLFKTINTDKDFNEVYDELRSLIRNGRFTTIEESIDVHNYYKYAFDEIAELEEIIVTNFTESNKLPITDSAYENWSVIDYGLDKEKYLKFLRYVEKFTKEGYSFSLKYLDINNLEMSSGERAILNFFSWLNLLPFFNKILPFIEEYSNPNILLFIDEIDLYCHPEWQRQFISFLLNELRNQFADKKIQVVFTTHSPILLSDIPKSNCVFLVGNDSDMLESKSTIVKKSSETFAQNIYTLYNDAFFLKETMGMFAKMKIDQIDMLLKAIDEQELLQKFDLEKLEDCKKTVNLIGDPVLRNFYASKLKKFDAEFQSQKLKEIIADFDQLDESEQASLIRYIIDKKEVRNI